MKQCGFGGIVSLLLYTTAIGERQTELLKWNKRQIRSC